MERSGDLDANWQGKTHSLGGIQKPKGVAWALGLGRDQNPRIGLTAWDRGGRRWRDHKLDDSNNNKNIMSNTVLPLWN